VTDLYLVCGRSTLILGDNVNLTSRLQGLNKAYGTNILISRDVQHFVKDKFLIRPLDRVAVKGKSKVHHRFNHSRTDKRYAVGADHPVQPLALSVHSGGGSL